jgi:hypothetical protein
MLVTTPQEVALEVGGVPFTLRLSPSPSGLRGQVWHGDERIAGVRLFHSSDVDRLRELAARNSAVLRAAARLSDTTAEDTSR